MVALARQPGFSLATFGDLLRVPASETSLEKEKARGADIHICYSPADSLELAEQMATRQVVMLAIGFETTTPAIAATVLQAEAMGLENWSIYCVLKKVPPALQALLAADGHNLDGLILPGHVAAVTGRSEFDFIAARYGIPAAVTGFEPVDLCLGLYQLLCSLREGEKAVSNAYPHVVREQGNRQAQNTTAACFETADSHWRGFGSISGSGLKLRKHFARFDAQVRFALKPPPVPETENCLCGPILTGRARPPQCPHFGTACTPLSPIGPCMVSTEGACSAYYQYGNGRHTS
jgi:hydrogenase expression/formation protein HypD